MVGWLVLKEEKGLRVLVERTAVLGIPLLRAEAPVGGGLRERTLLRRVARAAELLRRGGCTRVLTPAGFLHWKLLTERGLRPVDPSPLCQALAAPLALAFLERAGVPPQSATVLLRGSRVSRPMFQAAETLCARVRRLVVSAPSGGEELAQYLRGEYGLPSLEEGACEKPDAALVFTPGETRGSAELLLCPPGPELKGLSPRAIELSLPENAEPVALLALLWEEGRIGIDNMEIISI